MDPRLSGLKLAWLPPIVATTMLTVMGYLYAQTRADDRRRLDKLEANQQEIMRLLAKWDEWQGDMSSWRTDVSADLKTLDKQVLTDHVYLNASRPRPSGRGADNP